MEENSSSATSPANSNSFARARLSSQTSYHKIKNLLKNIIKKVQFSIKACKNTVFTKTSKDEYNKGVKTKKGERLTKLLMFVDDSIFADIDDYSKMTMATSIEANVYFLMKNV